MPLQVVQQEDAVPEMRLASAQALAALEARVPELHAALQPVVATLAASLLAAPTGRRSPLQQQWRSSAIGCWPAPAHLLYPFVARHARQLVSELVEPWQAAGRPEQRPLLELMLRVLCHDAELAAAEAAAGPSCDGGPSPMEVADAAPGMECASAEASRSSSMDVEVMVMVNSAAGSKPGSSIKRLVSADDAAGPTGAASAASSSSTAQHRTLQLLKELLPLLPQHLADTSEGFGHTVPSGQFTMALCSTLRRHEALQQACQSDGVVPALVSAISSRLRLASQSGDRHFALYCAAATHTAVTLAQLSPAAAGAAAWPVDGSGAGQQPAHLSMQALRSLLDWVAAGEPQQPTGQQQQHGGSDAALAAPIMQAGALESIMCSSSSCGTAAGAAVLQLATQAARASGIRPIIAHGLLHPVSILLRHPAPEVFAAAAACTSDMVPALCRVVSQELAAGGALALLGNSHGTQQMQELSNGLEGRLSCVAAATEHATAVGSSQGGSALEHQAWCCLAGALWREALQLLPVVLQPVGSPGSNVPSALLAMLLPLLASCYSKSCCSELRRMHVHALSELPQLLCGGGSSSEQLRSLALELLAAALKHADDSVAGVIKHAAREAGAACL